MGSRTLSVLGEQFKKFVVCAVRTVFSTPPPPTDHFFALAWP